MSERGSKPPNDFEAPQAPLLFGEGRACWRVQLAGDQRTQHHCLCTKLSACPAIPHGDAGAQSCSLSWDNGGRSPEGCPLDYPAGLSLHTLVWGEGPGATGPPSPAPQEESSDDLG